jgi:hypothetical protein
MQKLIVLFLLFSTVANAKTRECKWEKKWDIVIPEKNINCKKVDTRTYLLYWSGSNVKMQNCKITSGTWSCYYSKKIYNLTSRKEISKLLQIDHILPWHELKNRGILNQNNPCIAYNDIDNLVIASSIENQAKSDFVTKPIYLKTKKEKHQLYYNKNYLTWHETKTHLFKDINIISCNICTKYQLMQCKDFCNN